MSSPASVIFTTNPNTVILSASAIQAAMLATAAIAVATSVARAGVAIHAAQQEAQNLRGQHAAQAVERAAEQSAAQTAGLAALDVARQKIEARYVSLVQRAQPLGLAAALLATRPVLPVTPNEATHFALADYIEQMRAHCQKLEAALLEAWGGADSDALAQTLESELSLDALLAQQHAVAELGDASGAARASQKPPPAAAIRLLARLANLGPLPEIIERLARELTECTQQSRAQLLELELRRAIAAFEQEALQKASALVLEHTLQELGYQVEPIGETLFVEGGVLHFRRQSWGNYLVRLRLDTQSSSLNFNVIRAVQAGENERSVLDHLAEDRWCAEFPALRQALAARGLACTVTREVSPGELPVQLVEQRLLPTFADEEVPNAAPILRQREIR